VPEIPSVPRAAELSAAVSAAFAPGGPLARALPGFEARQGQLDMADAVAAVFADGGVLLAEAGTGTGKTLAYLIPAIYSRQRVLISTGTKNLQEQIFYKDLPVLREALGVDFTATYMKGRGNYLCLHRFEDWRHRPGPRSADERAYVRLISEWARGTETGDRAEIEDLPEDLPFWNDIAATSENCLGADCPRYGDCYITLMRQRAAASDLVIVNHHLLCADAAVRQSAYGEVIPACSFAILDEAHQLEDVARYFGMVSNYRAKISRDGDRAVASGSSRSRRRCSRCLRVLDHERDSFGAAQRLRFDAPRSADGSQSAGPSSGSRPGGPGGLALEAATRARRPARGRRPLGWRAGDSGDLRPLLQRRPAVFTSSPRPRCSCAPVDVWSIVEPALDRAGATSATLAVMSRSHISWASAAEEVRPPRIRPRI
jgi:ATP-dependent DNA helicase DinG